MADAGIHDVQIERTNSFLGDHYDPRNQDARACRPTCTTASLWRHWALRRTKPGMPFSTSTRMRRCRRGWRLFRLTMFSSQLLPLVVIGGFFFHIPMFITLGIGIYAVLVVFQLITLPVEFDASSRAKVILQKSGLIARDEMQASIAC